MKFSTFSTFFTFSCDVITFKNSLTTVAHKSLFQSCQPIFVDDDNSRLLSTLENRIDRIEYSQQRILNLDIAENLDSMQLRIDEVEKNVVPVAPVTVVSQNTASDQYREVQVKLEQLQGTQNSMKVNYEKLFEQSKQGFEP